MGYDENTYNKIVEYAKNNNIEGWNKEYGDRLAAMPDGFKPYSECDDDEKEVYFPQLDGADFRGMDLRGIFLYGASLREAKFDPKISILGRIDYTNLEGSTLEFAQLVKANLSDTRLYGASLLNANLSEANLTRAQLGGVILRDANMSNIHEASGINLDKAELIDANLSGSLFSDAYLNGTIIIDSDLRGTTIYLSCVDDKTLLTGKSQKRLCDEHTNFTGTNLSQIRTTPELRFLLEKNIRKKYWKQWYFNHKILQIPLRGFWFLSDYGTTSKPCILFFFGLIGAMYIIYSLLTPIPLEFNPELLGNTILATFGIGDPWLDGWGRLLVAFHSICGYFLLAVLITRFAVMFQSLSP